MGEPGGAGAHSNPPDYGDHVSGGALGIFYLHLDSVDNCGGLMRRRSMRRRSVSLTALTARNSRELHGGSVTDRQLSRDAAMTQQVRSISRDVEDDLIVGDRQRVEELGSGCGRGVELEDAGVVGAEAELFGRAEHAVRFDAADLAALELEATRQRRADGREGVRLPR